MTITNLPLEWLALADAVLKATMILAGAAAASLTLRRASAAMRHLIWTLGLCGALILPMLSIALPKWHLPLFSVALEQPPIVEPLEPADLPPAPTRGSAQDVQPPGAPRLNVEPGPVPSRSSIVELVSALTWQQTLLAIWLTGVALVTIRLVVGIAAVHWLSRRTQIITDASWLPMARALASEMGVANRLRFLRSSRASMPVAAGIFRPSIIMPADADGWSDSRLRIVLLHELAHVKRRDCLTHLVAQAACAFYWFNPLAWLAARRARTERERACDDLVLASGTRGPDYADQLLELARAMNGGRFSGLLTGASLAMAHQSQLEGRLIAILDPKVPRAGVSRARALAATALFCGAVTPLGALQPWTAADEISSAPRQTALVSETAIATAGRQPTPRGTARVSHPTAGQQREEGRQDLQVQAPQLLQTRQLPQGPQMPQAPPPASLPEPTPIFNEVLGPIAQAAIDAVAQGVDNALENTVGKAVEGALQNPKPDPDPKPNKAGAGAGKQVDPRLIAALTAALKDTDKEVRENAMHALVRLRDPVVFEPLVQALKDPSPDVREQAVHGLSQLRDRRAVEPLSAALKDENADVREQAAHALGQLRDRSVVPALMTALKDANADVREQAAHALGQLRDVSAVDGLALAVRDENPDVREQAVFALSQIRDRRAVGPLISALKDASADVRKQAAFALSQLRDSSAVDALIIAIKDANAEVREQVAFALGQIRDPRAIDALSAALKDQSADVRQQAAFALGQLIR